MDRNSVLAFLLIAIIILFMPEYYKLVYPDLQQTDSTLVATDGSSFEKKELSTPVVLQDLKKYNKQNLIRTHLFKLLI